ncbi:MAG: tetratricopeptide repeat protein [candidate division Zixibacteria bacterium]|nr:tetratricopeptide repeat protein [candidate division Zixibacteria bacterium]
MKRLSILAYLICFATVTYAQQGVPPYDVLMRSGKIYTQSKDYVKAMELFSTAVKNYPDEPEARYWLGTLYHDRSNFKEMILQFRQFNEIYAKAKSSGDKKLIKTCEKDDMPKQIKDYSQSAFMKTFSDGVVQLKHADSLARESRNLTDDTEKTQQQRLVNQLFDKANSLFAECLTIDDTVSGVYTNIGLVESKKGNNQGALDMYRKAHQLAPNDHQLLFSLASTFSSLQQNDSAALYFGAFADKDSLNREAALINQAMCYQAMNDEKRFEGSLDNIIKVNPQNAEILYQRGVLYVRQASAKVLTDSTALLDSIAQRRPNDEAIEKAKADLLSYRRGLYEKAFPDFKAAAELTKTDPDYWYWFGTTAMLTDKMDDARTAYAKCVEVKPDNQDCWCQLVLVYAKLKLQKEFDEASAKCPKK